MNGSDRINELFDRLSKTPSFLSEENVKDLFERRLEGRRAGSLAHTIDLYRRTTVWVMAGAGLLVLGIILSLRLNHSEHAPVARFDNPNVVKQADSAQIAALSQSDESRPVEYHQRSANMTSFASWVPRRIEPIKFYELDTTEFTKLGIYVRPQGLIYWVKGSSFCLRCEDDTSSRIPPSPTSTSSGRLLEFEKNLHDAKAITDGKGRKYFYGANSSATDSTLMSVVPILLDMKKTCAADCRNLGRHFIFWYDYSKGLLDLLPARIRGEIQSDRLKNDANRAGKAAKDRELLVDVNISKDTKSAIVDYQQRDNEDVAFSFFDIKGAMLETIAAGEPCGRDVCRMRIPMDKLHPGIYLLAVHNNQGQSVVRRVYAQ